MTQFAKCRPVPLRLGTPALRLQLKRKKTLNSLKFEFWGFFSAALALLFIGSPSLTNTSLQQFTRGVPQGKRSRHKSTIYIHGCVTFCWTSRLHLLVTFSLPVAVQLKMRWTSPPLASRLPAAWSWARVVFPFRIAEGHSISAEWITSVFSLRTAAGLKAELQKNAPMNVFLYY